MSGFEPEASWTRTKRDTKLRHTPSAVILYVLFIGLSSEKVLVLHGGRRAYVRYRKGCERVRIARNDGKRVQTDCGKKRRNSQSYGKNYHEHGKDGGKRLETATRREKRQLRRWIFSATVLVGVIAVKLLSPQTLAPVQTELLRLMGTDTDAVAAFSAVGKAVSGQEGWAEMLNDAYVAVFGAAEGEGAAGLPEDVSLLQKSLGFAYVTPLTGSLTDGFGLRLHPVTQTEEFHYGLDIEAQTGAVIGSFAAGTVTAVGESSALGKYVTVAHENGFSTLYAHCSRITASSGQKVQPGDPIAEVGQTGLATGPHLHFELQHEMIYLNPIYYVEI